jgi:hypothetical protein
MRASLVATVLIAFTAAGCGLRFGPGFSSQDSRYFSEPPRIIVKGDARTLRWRYGEMGFYFSPSSKVSDGQLLFALQATTSTGARAGQIGEVLIWDAKRIHALDSGGAFWVEPNGDKVPLLIIKE